MTLFDKIIKINSVLLNRAYKKAALLRRHVLVSTASISLGLAAVMLMTGILYVDECRSMEFTVERPLNWDARTTEVRVSRVTYRERVQTEQIPYESSVEYSNLIAIGDSVTAAGEYGEVALTLRERLVDGVVVNSEVLKKEYTREPVNEVITHGRARSVPYSKRDFPEIRLENGIPVDYTQKLTGQSTAYTAGPRSGTASGRPLEIGTVAVDPRIIPYGSLLYIMTSCGSRVYGAAIAADTGGFIHYTDRFVVVDVYMGLTADHYHEALRWGVYNVDVYVINTGIY
jgi:3D (Asp-Asp-Asp) domain-containing protein